VHAIRISRAKKDTRDILLYGIWKTGQLKELKYRQLIWVELFRGQSGGKISKTQPGQKSTIID
jgi:hypothetical protein